MKKVTARAAAVALCVLLAACSTLSEKNYMDDLPALTHAPVEYAPRDSMTITPALYYYDGSLDKLAAESRDIVIADGDDPLEAIIRELLQPPADPSLRNIGRGMQFEYAELCEEVCCVYLTGSPWASMDEFDTYILGCAISATIADYFDTAVYTQLFIDGFAANCGRAVCEPFVKVSGSVSEAFSAASSAEYEESDSVTADIVLWFLDSNERCFLPEVRTITAPSNAESFIHAVLGELAQGPKNKSYVKAVVNKSNFEGTEITEADGSISIAFEKYPYEYTDTNQNGDELCTGALVYTLTGIAPVSDIQMTVGSSRIRVLERHEYRDHAGERLSLYMPDKTYSMLLEVERTMPQGRARSIDARLAALINGPGRFDSEDVYPAFPDMIEADDVLNVYVNDDLAVVDFSADIAAAIRTLSADGEYMMVYSIVNTLTGYQGIKRVLMLSEGREIDVGGLYYKNPFIANPGVIRD